jgi:Spy/CpxP family protein refolding chaperone
MKTAIVTLALLCAGAAYAQTPPPPPHGAEAARHMDDLATLLDLTDAQKAQVQTILQEEHAKMHQSFEQAKASGTRPDWQQMKALHEQMQQETLQKLSSVLSATQLKKFQVIQQEMHSHMGHHMGHGGPEAATTPPAQN